MLILIVVLVLIVALLAVLWIRWRRLARADYIRRYMFPTGLFDRLRKRRPELAVKDCQLVARALRQFFLAHLNSGCQFVSMPSQVVDDLWHEFILYTRHYQHFCRHAFGRFLHHTPAVVLGAERQNNAGLRRTWWHACLEENINPRKPTRLPLLFALDAKLNIVDGFRYTPDCAQRRRDGQGSVYCGGDFADSGIDGGTDGFGDGGGGGGGDGGCGGGCGGD
jgi:hypothetical protein